MAQSSRSRRKQWLSSKGAGLVRLPIAKVMSSTAMQELLAHSMRRVRCAENQGWNLIELLIDGAGLCCRGAGLTAGSEVLQQRVHR